MAGYVQVPPDGAGKRIDTVPLTDDLAEVHRQKMVIAGGSGTAEVVVVANAAPGLSDMGLVVRVAGNVNAISATVTVAGTVTVGVIPNVNVSTMPAVALAAGAANIGSINNISRTVAVVCSTPFILQGISTTVQVAIGTPFVLQGISTTVQVAVGTPFTLQGISTTVQVAIGTPFTVNGISATVVTVKGHLPQLPSTLHGPKCVTASTSAGVVLVAAPGAGFAVYVTSIACTNGSGTLTRADVFQGSATASAHCTMYMAASGGGFTMNYDPPIAVLSGTGVTCRVKPNVSKAIFNVHFYVDPK